MAAWIRTRSVVLATVLAGIVPAGVVLTGVERGWSQEASGEPAVAEAGSELAEGQEPGAEAGGAPASFQRSSGQFLSILKLLVLLLLLMLWVYTCDWVNRDCLFANMPHGIWNLVFVLPFFFAMLLALVIPVFIVGFLLTLVAYAVPLTVYVLQRNAKVHSDDQVLTASHIGDVLSGKRKESSREKKTAPGDKGPPVGLIAMGAETELTNKSNLLAAKQSPGFLLAREILHDALKRHADKIMLDYTAEIASVRMEIDGVWHDAGNREREDADPMLMVLKKIANLDIEDRRSRQKGNFGTTYRGDKHTWNFGSQGNKTGERAVLQMRMENGKPRTLEELGMRPALVEKMRELLKLPEGILMFSALPGGGLSTTLAAAMFCCRPVHPALRHV